MSGKKRKIHSGRKGKRGERLLLGPLEKWWGFPFHRTPSSGAWGTQHNNTTFSQDIICDDPNFPFDIEVKNCEGWHLEQLFTAPRSDLYLWWEQTVNQCAPDKKPMLCFRRNRHPFLIMTKDTDTPKDIELLGVGLTLWGHEDWDYNVEIYTLDQLIQCDITQWLNKD